MVRPNLPVAHPPPRPPWLPLPPCLQHRQLELFFPFDPYLLRRSAAHLALPSTYIRWRRGHPSGAVRAQLESESSSDSEGEELSESDLSELEEEAAAAPGAAAAGASSSDDDSDSSSSSSSGSSGYDSSSESDAVRRRWGRRLVVEGLGRGGCRGSCASTGRRAWLHLLWRTRCACLLSVPSYPACPLPPLPPPTNTTKQDDLKRTRFGSIPGSSFGSDYRARKRPHLPGALTAGPGLFGGIPAGAWGAAARRPGAAGPVHGRARCPRQAQAAVACCRACCLMRPLGSRPVPSLV